MYLKFVNNLAKPYFSPSKHANLPQKMSALSLGQIEVWRSLICNLTRWRQKQRIVVVEDPLNHLHNLHLFRYTFFTICLVPVRRFPVPLGQFVSVTYPRRTGGKRPRIFARTTWPEMLWPRRKMRPRDQVTLQSSTSLNSTKHKAIREGCVN